jgi:N-acetylglutamate synthase/N-acetylornithine aminotransferase
LIELIFIVLQYPYILHFLCTNQVKSSKVIHYRRQVYQLEEVNRKLIVNSGEANIF